MRGADEHERLSLTKAEIIALVRAEPDKLDKRALARSLGVKGDTRRDLRGLLKTMVEDGELILSRNRKTYRVPGELPAVTVVSITEVDDDGDLWGRPEVWKGEGEPPRMRVREESPGRSGTRNRAASLGVGDRALARLKTGKDARITAVVFKKLPKQEGDYLGVLAKTDRGWTITPVSKKARDVYSVRDVPATVAPDSRTLVRYRSLSGRGRADRQAKVLELVGPADSDDAATMISLEEHGIPTEFPPEAIEQAKSATMPEIGGARQDLRDLDLITIDPVDAKDFDDAVLAIPDGKGGYRVWVAIADVAAFVTPGSPLDKEAYRRGNSVYLPDRVIPMLPHELSSDLCSLRPKEERACMAVEMHFDKTGKKQKHRFHRGIMLSKARLTYAQAQEAFDGHAGPIAEPVAEQLGQLYAAYKVLRTAREKRGPLEIDLPERRVHLDDRGQVTAITVKQRFDAHKLIEEFMVQANVCAAESLGQAGVMAVQRVHEPPAFEKVQALSEFLKLNDIKWNAGERVSTKTFNRLLGEVKEGDLAEAIGMSVLRTQSQAVYAPESSGHFGLNLTHYAHFTSPIRRYADLVVHRALIKAFNLGDDGITKEESSRLQEIGEHISTTERRAMAAERDAVDRYIAAYLDGKEGTVFGARISGVTKFGLFITLDETGADGLIPVRDLGDEYMVYDEARQALVGQQTGGTYRLGQRIKARLVEASPITGGMIFGMETKPEKGKPPKGRGRPQSRGGDGRRKGGGKGGSKGGGRRKRR